MPSGAECFGEAMAKSPCPGGRQQGGELGLGRGAVYHQGSVESGQGARGKDGTARDEGAWSWGNGLRRAGKGRSVQLSLEDLIILIRIILFKEDALLQRGLSRGSADKPLSGAARFPARSKLLLSPSPPAFPKNDPSAAPTGHGQATGPISGGCP